MATHDRSLLASAGRRRSLARRPLVEYANQTSPKSTGGQKPKLALSDDDEDNTKHGGFLDDVSSVESKDAKTSAEDAGSPPNENFTHSSPCGTAEDPPTKPKPKPRRSSSRTTKKNLYSTTGTALKETAGNRRKPEGGPLSPIIGEALGKTSTEGATSWLLTISVFVSLCVIGVYFQQMRWGATGGDIAAMDTMEKFKQLREAFPSQSNTTWKIIKSQFRRIIRKDSNQAACMTIVGDSPQVGCFAKAVGDVLTAALVSSDVETEPLTFEGDQRIHERVENELRRASVVVIFDIDKVDGKTAMELHPFCDSTDLVEGHPFVHSAVISTIAAKRSKEVKVDQYADQVLSEAWERSVSKDKISSLVSRVALSTIDFESESSINSLEHLCPRVAS